MPCLNRKVALVTGASTGIGQAIAARLFDRGATVVIASRRQQEIAAVARALDPSGQRAVAIAADVRDPAAVERLVAETLSRCGQLHFLVNNAGITGPHGVPICDYSIADWHDVIETDLSGTFYAMKYALPAILASGGGAVVNLSSANGVVGIAGIAPYTTAKHGLIGMTRSAALEFAERGIRINAIGPGYVDTPNMQRLPAAVREKMADSHPMKRLARCEEVANLTAFLLSDQASFITGAFYAIDGGYTAQ